MRVWCGYTVSACVVWVYGECVCARVWCVCVCASVWSVRAYVYVRMRAWGVESLMLEFEHGLSSPVVLCSFASLAFIGTAYSSKPENSIETQ